ncbi:MAG: hypothetical protein V4581_14410 [Bacteroidota bacterium]
MKILITSVLFAVVSALSLTSNSSEMPPVTAYQATTDQYPEVGPQHAWFQTKQCRTIFLGVHPEYWADGTAVVPDTAVFICL